MPQHSQSLERGLMILSAFNHGRPLLGITELSAMVGLTKSTTHRYIATLAALGYLQQDKITRRYRLGPRAVDLGLAAINSIEVTQIAAPLLQALSDETGHTVSMAILDGTEIVYVERCRSARESSRLGIDLHLHVGSRLPAYCTSMGKVLLAYRPPDTLTELIDRMDLARRGPHTLTAREPLIAALRRIRQAGWAANDEELAPGLRSVAVPLRDASGEVVAAVNIAIHLSIWNASMESIVRRLEPPLQHTAREISAQLGLRFR
jgi:IclR family pca regulon transcriptional regulator